MKITINIPGMNGKKQLVHLKDYMESKRIEGLRSLKFETAPVKKGEMAVVGAIGPLVGVVMGAVNPMSRIVQAFSNYTSSFRTEIILKNEFGDELVLTTKKLDEKGIQLLVDKFLKKT